MLFLQSAGLFSGHPEAGVFQFPWVTGIFELPSHYCSLLGHFWPLWIYCAVSRGLPLLLPVPRCTQFSSKAVPNYAWKLRQAVNLHNWKLKCFYNHDDFHILRNVYGTAVQDSGMFLAGFWESQQDSIDSSSIIANVIICSNSR